MEPLYGQKGEAILPSIFSPSSLPILPSDFLLPLPLASACVFACLCLPAHCAACKSVHPLFSLATNFYCQSPCDLGCTLLRARGIIKSGRQIGGSHLGRAVTTTEQDDDFRLSAWVHVNARVTYHGCTVTAIINSLRQELTNTLSFLASLYTVNQSSNQPYINQ